MGSFSPTRPLFVSCTGCGRQMYKSPRLFFSPLIAHSRHNAPKYQTRTQKRDAGCCATPHDDSYLGIDRGCFECHLIIRYLALFLREHAAGLYGDIYIPLISPAPPSASSSLYNTNFDLCCHLAAKRGSQPPSRLAAAADASAEQWTDFTSFQGGPLLIEINTLSQGVHVKAAPGACQWNWVGLHTMRELPFGSKLRADERYDFSPPYKQRAIVTVRLSVGGIERCIIARDHMHG